MCALPFLRGLLQLASQEFDAGRVAGADDPTGGIVDTEAVVLHMAFTEAQLPVARHRTVVLGQLPGSLDQDVIEPLDQSAEQPGAEWPVCEAEGAHQSLGTGLTRGCARVEPDPFVLQPGVLPVT